MVVCFSVIFLQSSSRKKVHGASYKAISTVLLVPASVVVAMETSSLSDKGRAKNQRQLAWLLLLELQRALSSLSWSLFAFGKLLATAQRRIFFRSPEKPQKTGRLLIILRAFLIVSAMALLSEGYAHKNELHLSPPWEGPKLEQRACLFVLALRAQYMAPSVIYL